MSNLIDVAKLARVSTATVSKVVNGRTSRMEPEMLRRVQQAIAELEYRPNRAARFLKTGETPLIGFLVPSIVYPSWSWLAREVETIAQNEFGYRVLVGNTYRDPAKEIEFIRDLLSHGIRGAIIVSPLMEDETLEEVIGNQLVAVSYDRRAPKTGARGADFVSIDHTRTMQISFKHLVANGHKRIAFVTVSGKSPSREEKIEAFLDEAKKAGLANSAEVIESKAMAAYGDDEMPQLGRQVAIELAARKVRPTGLIALNDLLAIGLMVGLQECGLRVPEDVSVIGIDDVLLSAYQSPALTTIRPPVEEMARTMVHTLMRRLRDSKAEPLERIFEPTLIERASVARPLSTKSDGSPDPVITSDHAGQASKAAGSTKKRSVAGRTRAAS